MEKKCFKIFMCCITSFLVVIANVCASTDASDYEIAYGYSKGTTCGIGINNGETQKLTNFTCERNPSGAEILQATYSKNADGDILTFEKDAKIYNYGGAESSSKIIVNGNNAIQLLENQNYTIAGNGTLMVSKYQAYEQLTNNEGNPLFEVFYDNGLTASGTPNSIHLKDEDGNYLLITSKEELASIFENIKAYNPELSDATYNEENISFLQKHMGMVEHNINESWVKEHITTDLNVFYNEDGTVTFSSVGSTLEYENVIFESKSILDKNYKLDVIDTLKNATDELKDAIKKASKDLIALYDISVVDVNNNIVPMKDGSFTIKIKLTDTMKKYNSLTVAYILDSKIVETFDTTNDGEYVTFNTTHLSEYAILGSYDNNSETIENPSTGDNIISNITILSLSIVGIGFLIYALKKGKCNN